MALLSSKLYAETKVAIGIIPGAIEDNPKLSNNYMSFIRQLDDSTLEFVPMARADLLFERHLVDCVFPGSTAQMSNREKLGQSKPLRTIYAYIFVKDKETLQHSFKDKNIALRRGLGFGNVRERLFANFIDLNSDELALKMLNKGRVDAVVAYFPDLVAAQHKMGERHLPYYDEKRPIYQAEEALVCHKNIKTDKYISTANQLIKNLVQSN